MPPVARYVKMTARAGQGAALAGLMLRVAEGLRGTPGCELYVINRAPHDFLAGGTGSTVVSLDDVEDSAAKFGYGAMGEARFATGELHAAQTGVSLQRLRPGVRQAFGHRHQHAEEVFVVLAGDGRVKIDEDIRELRALDAVRIAPESARAFEAGPNGLDLLAFGPRRPGDAVMDKSFWPA